MPGAGEHGQEEGRGKECSRHCRLEFPGPEVKYAGSCEERKPCTAVKSDEQLSEITGEGGGRS